MRTRQWVLLLLLVPLMLAAAGCSCGRIVKQAQQAREAVRLAKDAQDGKFTVKDAEGQEAKVEIDKDKKEVKVTTDKGEGYKAKFDEKEEKLTVETEEGTGQFQVGSADLSEKDIGLAFYPGAKVKSSSEMSFGSKKFQTVTLNTTDSFDQVVQFYQKKYADNCIRTQTTDGDKKMSTFILKGQADQGKTILIAKDQKENEVVVTLTGYRD